MRIVDETVTRSEDPLKALMKVRLATLDAKIDGLKKRLDLFQRVAFLKQRSERSKRSIRKFRADHRDHGSSSGEGEDGENQGRREAIQLEGVRFHS